jgi:hypothetical protein
MDCIDWIHMLVSQALVVASGGATTLIVNNMFAKYWHKEYISPYVVWGVAAVVVGAVLLAAFAPSANDLDLEHVLRLAQAPFFIAYVIVIFFCIASTLSLIASSWFFKSRRKALMGLLKPMRQELQLQHQHQRLREKHMWRRMQLIRSALTNVLAESEPGKLSSKTLTKTKFPVVIVMLAHAVRAQILEILNQRSNYKRE